MSSRYIKRGFALRKTDSYRLFRRHDGDAGFLEPTLQRLYFADGKELWLDVETVLETEKEFKARTRK